MAETLPISAQMEVLVADTPIKDMQTADLITILSLERNYPQRIVWVLSEQCYYYLQTGDGTLIGHWKKHETLNSKIPAYDSLLPYTQNDSVWISGSVYVALGNVSPSQDPVNNPLLWQKVSGGGADQYKFTFTGTPTVVITSPKSNPHVSVYIGDVLVWALVEKSSDTDIIVKFKNAESGYILV